MRPDRIISAAQQGVARKPRIFFFGAHKVLVKTELIRLRALGYEVFNPPYLSNVLDQSVQYVWDSNQESTLPREIFQKLSRYSFFFNTIDEEIADILNSYFDAVIVTLVAGWATEVARAFSGPVIFRSYGQTSLLSENFDHIGGRSVVEDHPAFYFCPFADEVVEQEASWLRDRAIVIPYCLSDDVFERKGQWNNRDRKSGDIIVTAPNIAGNVFHQAHYNFINEYFPQNYIKMCGVQFVPVDDPRVMGSMKRSEQLDLFNNASGYLYTYTDPRVCYLPPVEMAVLGGPVVYLKGSLLSRYIGGGPGEAVTIDGAQILCDRLRARDVSFISEVKASQGSVIKRYDPDYVWPIFDREMGRLLPKVASRPDVTAPTRGEERDDQLKVFVRRYLSQAEAGEPVLVTDEDREAIGSHLTKNAPIISRDMNGRQNYLTEGCTVVANWRVDPEACARAAVSDVGTSGWLVYGPYIALAPGRYRVTFDVVVDLSGSTGVGQSDVVGSVDVAVAGVPFGSVSITSQQADRGPLTVQFDAVQAVSGCEFRVHSTGSARLVIMSIIMQRGDQ